MYALLTVPYLSISREKSCKMRSSLKKKWRKSIYYSTYASKQQVKTFNMSNRNEPKFRRGAKPGFEITGMN